MNKVMRYAFAVMVAVGHLAVCYVSGSMLGVKLAEFVDD